jgi:hypothetical protein
MGRFTGILGIGVILGLAWLFSTDRRAIKLKTVLWGFGLQLALGFFVLKSSVGGRIFGFLGNGANKLLSYSYAGSSFVFGDIGLPKELSRLGFSFAFQVLPTIIFIAAFFAVLYHIGVMQLIIRGAAWLMQRVMGASGAESLNVAASIFMGQTEAPLTIKPFLAGLTERYPRNCGFHARYILRLKEHYETDDIHKALLHAERYQAFDAKSVERILHARATPRTLESIRNERAGQELAQTLPKITQRPLEEYGALFAGEADHEESDNAGRDRDQNQTAPDDPETDRDTESP